MKEKGIIRLDLMIGGRSFPVKVEKHEVDGLKKIEGEINSKINEYMVNYPNYNQIDIITMALLSIVFELNKQKIELKSVDIGNRLNDVLRVLDSSE